MVKANALYRDGSKLSQPLSGAAAEDLDVGAEFEAPTELPSVEQAAERIVQIMGERRRLPHRRAGYTQKATLAGHKMQHELEVAGAANALGSIDANTGDELLGWDTDQFPTNI